MKKILLTNDDGLDCDGIHVLARELSKVAEVWMIAPDRNRSAVSHGITMFNPLTIKKIDTQIFSCSGLPADCVMVGIKSVMENAPDIVISGINEGGNIGTDVLFSGTAAGARQACLYGIPSIAVSLSSPNNEWDYTPTAEFIKNNLDELVGLHQKDVFLNINTPSGEFQGCRFTNLSYREYTDVLHSYSAPNKNTYTFFEGGKIHTQGDDFSDFNTIKKGFVSITPVRAQPSALHYGDFEHISLKV
ncbi:MAG: 5'/3'-nucleotidase SurE [Treponemataceae bacterium]